MFAGVGPPSPLSLTAALFLGQPSNLKRLSELMTRAPHGLPPGMMSAAVSLSDVSPLIERLPVETLPPDIRRAVAARRLAFVAGRLCAEHAMQALQGRAHHVGRGAAGEPIWPADMEGSITHTSTMAAAAVGRRTGKFGIGIDSETCVDDKGLPDILHVCCTPEERRRLFGGPQDKLVATIVFSVKESLFKAVHVAVRRFVDFDEAEVQAIDWSRQRVRIVPNSTKPLAAQIPACVADFRIQADLVHTSVRPVERSSDWA